MDLNNLTEANKKLIELILSKCEGDMERANLYIQGGLNYAAINLQATKEELHETGSRPASLLAIGVNPFDASCLDLN